MTVTAPMIASPCPHCQTPLRLYPPLSLSAGLGYGYFSCPHCRLSVRCDQSAPLAPLRMVPLVRGEAVRLRLDTPKATLKLSAAQVSLSRQMIELVRAALQGADGCFVRPDPLLLHSLDALLLRLTSTTALNPLSRNELAYLLHLALVTTRPRSDLDKVHHADDVPDLSDVVDLLSVLTGRELRQRGLVA